MEHIDVLAQKLGKLIREEKDSVFTEIYLFEVKQEGGNFLSELLHRTANKITYTKEPEGRDYWQTVEETFLKKRGDCEDFTVVIGATLLRAGYPVLLKFTASKEEFDHVYPLSYDGKSWVALDGSLSNPGLDFEGSFSKSLLYTLDGEVVGEFDPTFSTLGWLAFIIVLVIILLRLFFRG